MNVYDIIVDKNLRSEQDIFEQANEQSGGGKTDLLKFILKLSNKRRGELIETAWKVQDSSKIEKRQQKTALEIR